MIALAHYDHESQPKHAMFLVLGFAIFLPLLFLAVGG
jgi:hypothetical protein